MTTAIHIADDLIRILRQDPEILEQVRRAILTDELLGLPEKVSEMLKTQAEMLKTQDRILKTQAEILKTQNEILDRLQRVEDRVGYLVGAEQERRVFRILPTRLRRMYQLRRTRVVLRQGDYTPDTQIFLDQADEALDSSIITDEQRDRLDLTDLIVRGTRRESQGKMYFAVEASGTIARRDIDRAVAASEALRDLYQTETVPVVAGYRIHRTDRLYAKENAVRTIILEEEAP